MPPDPLPSVSIVIPTLNCARLLDDCLASIRGQDYPTQLIEIVVADAGSSDGTLEVARRHAVDRIASNPLVTGEAGKAVGARVATKDILAFIDSDNLLEGRDWLRRMVAPFADERVVASEPLRYTHRRQDPGITRYCALTGVNDPLVLYLGNYDRYSLVTRRWTDLKLEQEDRGDWIAVRLRGAPTPTIGANGFLIRRSALPPSATSDYLFDVDIVAQLAAQNPILVAKVKTGIVHLYAKDLRAFARKQNRRIRDYLYYRAVGARPAAGVHPPPAGGLLRFVLYTILVVPMLLTSAVGYARKPDRAWWYHALVCLLTLFVYTWGVLRFWFGLRTPAPRPVPVPPREGS